MNQPPKKNIFLSCLVIMVFACVCTTSASVLGVAGYNLSKPEKMSAVTATPFPLGTLLGASTQDTDSKLTPEIKKKMDEIQVQVIQERGLVPNHTLTRSLLTPAELKEKVKTEIMAGYTEESAADDKALLSSFGVINSDFDIQNFIETMYSEQIAGYYDDVTQSMYVVSGSGFGAEEQLTYAHEYTHALQDQNYDLQNGVGLDDSICNENTDRCSAVQALIEGDASLSEEKWQDMIFNTQDYRTVMNFALNMNTPVFNSAPNFFQQDLLFPYTYGLDFVDYLYLKGGWDAVNHAYHQLPASTEQIMHPEKYPQDQPVEVTLPDISDLDLGGLQLQQQGTMGEWYLFLMLSTGENSSDRLDAVTAAKAAKGWGGDAYIIYTDPDQNEKLLVQCVQWDDASESGEFYQDYLLYGRQRWPGQETRVSDNLTTWNADPQWAAITLQDTKTCWLVAPNKTLADSILPRIEK
jgi:hypothetical protein